ncbi:MAG: 4a-hydroxytetrahydrobiopterin dehydratase [Cyanobacteria bacterium P01_C01_bin.69]
MATLLTDAAVQTQLQGLAGWQRNDQTITTTKTFDGFPSAIAFVNKLVDPAEAAGHHPDIEISYNKVIISLSTHDAGGLTQKDFDLAQKIEQL